MSKRVTYDRKHRTLTITKKFVLTDAALDLLRRIVDEDGGHYRPRGDELSDADYDAMQDLLEAKLVRRDAMDFHEIFHISKSGRMVLSKEHRIR